VLINPVTDAVTDDRDTQSEFDFFNGPFNTVPFMRKVIAEYIPDPDDRHSELATPQNISAQNAQKQPPTLILNAAADVLRDGGNALGEVLQRAGVQCTVLTALGQLHDSVVLEATRGGATAKALTRLIAVQIMDAVGEIKTPVAVGKSDERRSRILRKRKRVGEK
jgi:acetyl esterase